MTELNCLTHDSDKMEEKPRKEDIEECKDTNWRLFLVVLAVNIVTFSSGVSYGWASPTIPKMDGTLSPEDNPLPDNLTAVDKSWIASLHSLGSSFGPFLFGPLMDRVGRKNALIIGAIPMCLTNILMAFGNKVWYFYFGRLVGGFGMGAVFTVVPMYVGEVAEDRNRGGLGCLLPLSVGLGILYGYATGPYLSILVFNLTNGFPLVLSIIVLLFWLPETPYYLVMKGKMSEAEDSLRSLRINKEQNCISKELDIIRQNVRESLQTRGKLSDIFKKKGLRLAFVLVIGAMLFQQLTGINALLAFMQSIFEDAHISLPTDLATIAVGIVQFVACSIISFFVDRFGRKILLQTSILGCCIAQFVVALYFYLESSGRDVESIAWLPVASLVSFIVLYNAGLSTVPWVLLGEYFPQQFKPAASAIASFICLFTSFVVTVFYPYITASIGAAATFWMFSAFCALGLVFFIFLLPETKGKSLHEIQLMLNK